MVGIIILVVVLITLFILVLRYVFRRYAYSFVDKHSILLKQVNNINKKYNFYTLNNLNLSHSYDNEHFYDDISEEDYLIYQLQFISQNVSDYINQAHVNKERYMQYIKEINSISIFGQYDKDINKLLKKEANKLEKRRYKRLLMHPQVEFYIEITLYRTDINGKVFEKKENIFNERQIISLIRRVKNKRGNYFNDNEIWDAICRVERGKVSNKLRFAIYKRDGYRCRYCHRSDREVPLEIDHIIPISKGGKSEYDNLQTLCHDCNVRKGND